MDDGCPCGRVGVGGEPLAYDECCGPLLDDGVAARDAEGLMRSRYTAFVRQRADHLRATWEPAHRPRRLDLDDEVVWLGLRVLDHQVTGPTTAEVEFVARYRGPDGRRGRLHERSRFVRRASRWLYVDGDAVEPPGA